MTTLPAHPEDVVVYGSKGDTLLHRGVMLSAKWLVNVFVIMVGVDTIRFMIPPIYQLILPFFNFTELIHETPDENVNYYVGNLDELLMLSVGVLVTVGTYQAYVFIARGHKLATVYDGLTSGAVKAKMASGLIGLSSVSLTGTFIQLDNRGMLDGHAFAWSVLGMKLAIHGALIVGFVALALIERLNHPPVPHHAPGDYPAATVHTLPQGSHDSAPAESHQTHDGHQAA